MLVTLHRAGSFGLMGIVTLKAGPNTVAESDWAKVKDHPVLLEALRKAKNGGVTVEHETPIPKAAVVPVRQPEPMEEEPTPEMPVALPESGRLSARDTIELVKAMDLDGLELVEEEDERKTVLAACEARRAELLGDEE